MCVCCSEGWRESGDHGAEHAGAGEQPVHRVHDVRLLHARQALLHPRPHERGRPQLPPRLPRHLHRGGGTLLRTPHFIHLLVFNVYLFIHYLLVSKQKSNGGRHPLVRRDLQIMIELTLIVLKNFVFNLSDAFSTKVSTEIIFIAIF